MRREREEIKENGGQLLCNKHKVLCLYKTQFIQFIQFNELIMVRKQCCCFKLLVLLYAIKVKPELETAIIPLSFLE